VRALGRWIVALIVLALARGRGRTRAEKRRRIVPPGPPSPRAELAVLGLLGLASLCSIAFVVVYAVEAIPSKTQFFGLSLGLAFACLAAACVIVSRRLVPEEQLEEPYPLPLHPAEEDAIVEIVEESGDRLTRKRLLGLAAGGAGASLGLALIAPAASLGPALDPGRLRRTPWRRGVRLVDDRGRPLRADEIEAGSFYTAFPQGADPEQLGSPLVVVRLEPARLELPPGRSDWAPGGILAYSKICTHAGCAVTLYRRPLYEPTSARPALICPCHYSTFDPARGAAVLFGPAGRPLPQLPLAIGRDGALRAAGGFSDSVGPSWWGV
jgi:ubiquinol-cytochrome c reductase iron-sulfur subunit